MGIMANVSRGLRTMFGYDAVSQNGRRKIASLLLRSADDETTQTERGLLTVNGRDIRQNFAIAAWMIRRHLDYVSNFTFQAKTKDTNFNKYLEAWVAKVSRPHEYDVAGRRSREAAARMAEAARTVDGDILEVFMSDGRVQAIEGDRVRDPIGDTSRIYNRDRLFHGVLTDDAGAHLAYAVHARKRYAGGMLFERWVDARNANLFGYFDRFDQVRGVSPLAPALNTLRDTYKGVDYALGKMLVSQLFGLVFYRERAEEMGTKVTEAEGEGYQIDFGKGPLALNLDPGDRAEFLESKTPSVELQQFLQSTISIALKSLDIPFSFYDESFTNYSGARQALLQYQLSASLKQRDGQERLDNWLDRRMRLAADDGELQLNVDPDEIPWEFVPTAIPWIDPLKEVQAQVAAIEAGLTSRTRVVKSLGGNVEDVFDELQAEEAAASARGLRFGVTVASSIQQPPEVVTSGN